MEHLFSRQGFPARWQCGRWTDTHGWLHITSDALIFLSYLSIASVLTYALYMKRRILPPPFPLLMGLFIGFILLCGFTHLNEAIIFWWPFYRFAGVVKLATALTSCVTVIALARALPTLMQLRSSESLAQEVKRKTDELQRRSDAAAALAAITESSTDAMFSQDVEGTITAWNPASEKVYGYSSAEIIGHHASVLIPSNQQDEWKRITARVRQGERVELSDVTRLHKQGRRIPVSLIASPVYGPQEVISGISVMASDISEQKRIELELRRSNEELQQFAYLASHDLQEPLRIVASFSQLLAREYRGQLDAQAGEYIDFLVDAAKRMKRLVNDILEYSRLGRKDAKLELVSLSASVEDAMNGLQISIRESGATVDCDRLPTLPVRRAYINQVFQNLIGNAIKFRSEQPPHIHIGAYEEDSEWLIRVQDNGIGVEQAHLDRIFMMFQRLHSREQYDGTGIGLAITKKIIESHGGRMWAESEQGHGTCIVFTLPTNESKEAPP